VILKGWLAVKVLKAMLNSYSGQNVLVLVPTGLAGVNPNAVISGHQELSAWKVGKKVQTLGEFFGVNSGGISAQDQHVASSSKHPASQSLGRLA